MNQLLFACRQLIRAPAFTCAALLTLALGIGLSVASFSITNAFLLRPLSFPDSHQLLRVFRTSPQSSSLPHAPANALDLCARATAFSTTAIYAPDNYALGEPGQPAERVNGLNATAGLFDVLRVQPVLGRGFQPGDDQPGQPLVALLSHRAWTQRFGADPGVLGREVRLNGRTFTIVGVLPPEFEAPLVWGRAEFVTPLTITPALRTLRTSRWAQCVGRLKPGVEMRAAQGELDAIATALLGEFPKENAGLGLRAAPLHDSNLGATTRTMLWLVTGVSGLMLLIACANLASLQLARGVARTHDLAVRAALGGNRWQLMTPLVIESLLLAAVGGAGGLLVALWLNDFVGRSVVLGPDRGYVLPVDGRVLAFAGGAALLSGLACGLVPAWLAARGSAAEALKDATRAATAGRGPQRLKRALVAGTLALALALVGITASFGIGFWRFMHRPLNWEPDGLFAGNVILPESRYAQRDQQRVFHRALLERLAAIPGVEHAACAGSVPIYSLDGTMARTTALIAESQPAPQPGTEVATEAISVSTDYFAALGIRVRQGRTFPAGLQASDPPVAVVNQAVADRFWPGQDPIGRRLRFTSTNTLAAGEEWFEVIGVVENVGMLVRLDAPATRLQVYRSQVQLPSRYFTIVVRGVQPPEALVTPVRQAVAALDGDVAVAFAGSVRAIAELFQANIRIVIGNLAISSGLGLLIAAIGLFGVIAQLTTQRTREIGVRMALGACTADILRMIFGEGGRLFAIGAAGGLPAYLALYVIVRQGIPEVGLPGAWLVVANLLLLAAVTLLACWLPAKRAMHINPVEALRSE
ncbi:MAG TPA: ABC transporter permease [Lacunisphaera sp.]|nr:ABC transporter permease [Lacunisphaera sp.]